ncbi:MAG: hypothetical protein IJN53_04895 [Oscillospiraceae bacterium]|nr:hypothetical protein [Oscillospiraceae bacterium]
MRQGHFTLQQLSCERLVGSSQHASGNGPRRGPSGILRFVASFRTLVLIWPGLSYNNGLGCRIHPYQLIRRASNALWEQLRIGILPGLKLSLLLNESHLRLARIQAGFIGGAVDGITFLDFILNS